MTLLDLTRELFTYLVVFRQRAVSAAPPSLETVNEELEAVFQALEEQAREHPLLGGPYQQVRYGLTVLCDEVLLTSAWPQAVDWALEPLEQRLYGSRQGGTRFFQLLEEQEGAPRDVLAIYYLCLGLGFCGCYAPDDPRLEQIKAGLLARLRAPLKPPPPEPMPPPPRRPVFREQAPAPPAAPEPEPPAPEPFSEPPLEPEPQPVPMTAPGPPPEYPAVMLAPESPPAPPPSRSPALPETPARPRGRPVPPLRRARAGWGAAALALGAAGLAGVLLWVALGPWRDGPPSAQVRLGERAAATSPVPEEPKAKEPTPRPAVVEIAKATQPATSPPEQTAKGAETTPPPAMDMAKAPPPEPPPPIPEPAKAAEAPPPPPAIEIPKAPGPAPPPAVAVAKPPETAPPPAAVEEAKPSEPAPSPAVVDAPRPPEPAPLPPAPQAEPGVYILHAGLYVGPIQSGRLAQRLKGAGLPAFVRQEARGEGKVRYLVLVGPYQQEAQAQEAVENIQRRFGIKPFFMEPPAPPAAPLREPSGSNGSR